MCVQVITASLADETALHLGKGYFGKLSKEKTCEIKNTIAQIVQLSARTFVKIEYGHSSRSLLVSFLFVIIMFSLAVEVTRQKPANC